MGHTGSVNSFVFSKDEKYLISGGNDHLIKIWNFENGREIRTLGDENGYKESVAISRDEKYIICGY